MLWLYPTLTFFSFLILSKFLTPLLVKKFKLIDNPDNSRKIHTTSIPLVGGILIVCSTLLVYILNFDILSKFNTVLLTAVALLIIGVIDDKHDLNAKLRLFLQIASALILIFFNNTQLTTFGNLLSFGEIKLDFFSIPITIIAVVGMINAKNLIDGIDGLASGLSLICFLSLSYLLWGALPEVLLLLSLSAALLAFMSLNLDLLIPFYKNKMFLGDAGSLLLGFITVFFLIEYSQDQNNLKFHPITAVWITAIPLIDIAVTLTRRVINGKSPFFPDKTHIHHLLIQNGFSPRISLLILLTAQIFLSTLGCILNSHKEYFSFIIFIFVVLAYIAFSIILNKKGAR